MKILAIDISGKVEKYDNALYKCVSQTLPPQNVFTFACPYYSITNAQNSLYLCSLVPKQFRHSRNICKRLLKVVEAIINYIIVLRYIKKEHIDVLHLQWLPFMDVCAIEGLWLKAIRKMNPEIKIIMTMHNIYPHNSSAAQKLTYRKRIQSILSLIDFWIVHTQYAEKKLETEYGIERHKIQIIHHGIFIPETTIPPRKRRTDRKIRILLYGLQSAYKGTDILIESIQLLPHSYKKKLEVQIIGATESSFYNKYKNDAMQENIIWINQYVSESDLLQYIQDADVLIFPYRSITQSGALLLGLYFQKPLLVSNLPAFRETLGEEYPNSLIFESNDSQALANSIKRYIDNPLDITKIKSIIKKLIDNNSWQQAANKTIELYHSIAQ